MTTECTANGMSRGGIGELIRFALPLAVASVTTALNGFTDNFFLAHHSSAALSAALQANVLAGVLLALVTAVLEYSGTLLAQAYGGRRRAHAVAYASGGLWLTLASVPVFLAAIPTAHMLLGLFGHAPDVLAQERRLVSYLLAGAPLAVASAVLSGFFGGQGMTRVIGGVTILSVVAKILLTPLLVFGLGPLRGYGIDGAGLAYILAQSVALLGYGCTLRRTPLSAVFRRHPDLLRPRPRLVWHILAAGGPLAGRVFVGNGTFFVLVALIGRLDLLSTSVSAAVFAIHCPFNALALGLCDGIEKLSGQIYGEGRRECLRRLISSATRLVFLLSGAYILLLAAFGLPALEIFLANGETREPARALALGKVILALLALRITPEFLMFAYQSVLKGLGRTRATFLSSVIATLGVRLPGLAAISLCSPTLVAYWSLMVPTSLAGLLASWLFLKLSASRS